MKTRRKFHLLPNSSNSRKASLLAALGYCSTLAANHISRSLITLLVFSIVTPTELTSSYSYVFAKPLTISPTDLSLSSGTGSQATFPSQPPGESSLSTSGGGGSLSSGKQESDNSFISNHQTNASPSSLGPQAAAISMPANHQLEPPVIVNKPEDAVVAPGSNVTLTCEAQGSRPLAIVWFQDDRNMTKSTAPSTRLLEESRFEIFEELTPSNSTISYLSLINLRISDSSLFLCWVENSAGFTAQNYSVTVSDSVGQAHTLTTNLYQTAPNSAMSLLNNPPLPLVLTGFLVLLMAAMLFVGLHLYQCRGEEQRERRAVSKKCSPSAKSNEFNKSPAGADLNKSPSKYAASSLDSVDGEDEDEDEEEGDMDDEELDERDDELSQTSSCNKNNLRVLAVNDLDGFIEQMRSGIINMDYHSMSPVIQFNKTSGEQQQQPLAGGAQQLLRAQLVEQQQRQMLQQQQQQQRQFYQPAMNQTPQQQQQQQHQQQQQQQQQQYQAQIAQASAYLPPGANQAAYQIGQQSYQAPAAPTANSNAAYPQRQSYHQLAYMNQFPSSSSSHSSQTPFTSSYPPGGNGYYY